MHEAFAASAAQRLHQRIKDDAAARRGGPKPVRAIRYQVSGFTDQCIDRYLEVTKSTRSSLRKVYSPGMDDTVFSESDLQNPGTVAPSAASVLMKILYLARCIRFDLLHRVCMLAREIPRWTVACDKRLHRLVSYMHTTKDLSLEPFVGDNIADLSVVV